MVTDAILYPLIGITKIAMGWLPDGQPFAIGPLDLFWSAVRKFDSMIPVMGPVTAMLGLLSALIAFLVVRIVLTLWNLIYP